MLTYTRWGYEVRLSGANPDAARYAGIAVRRRIIAVMLLSGAIAGIAGMFEIAGTVHRLQGGISNNFGYVGIMVAILARGSCLGVIAGGGADGRHPQRRHRAADARASTRQHGAGVDRADPLFTAIGDELAHYRLVRTDAAEAGLRTTSMDIARRHPRQSPSSPAACWRSAALGEVLAERVGVVNLGVEGLMAMGAVVAVIVVMTSCRTSISALAAAIATGLCFGALFAVATVIVRANQMLCGLALTLIGTGLAATIGKPFSEHAGAGAVSSRSPSRT